MVASLFFYQNQFIRHCALSAVLFNFSFIPSTLAARCIFDFSKVEFVALDKAPQNLDDGFQIASNLAAEFCEKQTFTGEPLCRLGEFEIHTLDGATSRSSEGITSEHLGAETLFPIFFSRISCDCIKPLDKEHQSQTGVLLKTQAMAACSNYEKALRTIDRYPLTWPKFLNKHKDLISAEEQLLLKTLSESDKPTKFPSEYFPSIPQSLQKEHPWHHGIIPPFIVLLRELEAIKASNRQSEPQTANWIYKLMSYYEEVISSNSPTRSPEVLVTIYPVPIDAKHLKLRVENQIRDLLLERTFEVSVHSEILELQKLLDAINQFLAIHVSNPPSEAERLAHQIVVYLYEKQRTKKSNYDSPIYFQFSESLANGLIEKLESKLEKTRILQTRLFNRNLRYVCTNSYGDLIQLEETLTKEKGILKAHSDNLSSSDLESQMAQLELEIAQTVYERDNMILFFAEANRSKLVSALSLAFETANQDPNIGDNPIEEKTIEPRIRFSDQILIQVVPCHNQTENI